MDYDVTIIGAGVVGLAVARKLSESYGSLLIIDKEESFGRGISSRNSEVIHSGIYYKPNSIKATLCIKGQSLLYEYCNKKSIPHNICGKLIVAQGDIGSKRLNELLINAQKNGAISGRLCSKEEISELEPHLKAEYGLYFPRSGVIDSHQLMFNLLNDAKENGADIAYKVDVKDINKLDDGYEIIALDTDLNKISFSTKILINSSGLFANEVSEMAGIIDPEYKIEYWKGEYFSVSNGKEKFVSKLIYPLPEKNNIGLGIHTTTDISGRLKLGPSSFYLKDHLLDYSVNNNKKIEFYHSIKDFLPFIDLDDLNPDYSGIRPKLKTQKTGERDFIIKNESDRGYNNFINLIGIESPGLTASMAIGEYISNRID